MRIGFCGEISSGKSTALQAVLRRELLPDFLGLDTRPVIRVILGGEEPAVVLRHHNGEDAPVASTAEIEPSDGIAEISITLTKDFGLGPCELVEIPPFRDGHIEADQVRLVTECSAIVWTTIASQAWRLSEKTILDEIKAHLPKHLILVATRADKLRNDTDRTKLEGRLEKEASGYFPMGQLLGLAPKLFATPGDEAAWAASGATDLVSLFAKMLKDLGADLSEAETPAWTPEVSEEVEVADVLPETARVEDGRDSDADGPEPVVEAADALPDPKPEPAVVPPVPMAAREAPSPRPSAASLDDAIDDVRGILAFSVVDMAQDQSVEHIFGDKDLAESIAEFCRRSAATASKLVGLDGSDTRPEFEQIIMKSYSIVYRIKEDSILVFCGDAATMSMGIARTSFLRLAQFYDAQNQTVSEAA